MRRTLRGLQVLLESCARHLPVAASRSPSACRISHLSMCSTPLLAMKVRLRDLDEHERRQCADRPVECQYCQRAFVQLPLCAHHNPWLPRCCATHSTHAACFVCCPLHATLNTPRCMQLAAHCMPRAFPLHGGPVHASDASVRLLSQVDNGTFRRGRTQYCRANGEGHAVTCP